MADKIPHRSVNDLVPGDYVKYGGQLHKIKEIYGVGPGRRLAKPSEGGFGVHTEDGQHITMWQAQAYHKKEDVEK